VLLRVAVCCCVLLCLQECNDVLASPYICIHMHAPPFHMKIVKKEIYAYINESNTNTKEYYIQKQPTNVFQRDSRIYKTVTLNKAH